ncbi:lipopolysaccharide core heptose(I) kinase RfaP [Cellvibrio mixtus]|uniref:lipopolysaccharide core heptose(I) kinase RfaP n=1 Tax=Cellvibrio mixtus TaxID=39650 RepID=UPI0006942074|nr:lipopolysaccharide core heptose(I) kinase RfaP [Cellvibrio mixtus]
MQMRLAFVIFRYFPFGGLQRDMLALAQFFQQQGHSITVFCERWQGEKPPSIAVVEIPARGLLNVAGVKYFVERFEQQFPRAEFDALIGFNKMPGLDAYFAGDTCFAYKAFCERNWLYRLMPRSRLYLHYESAVFNEQSDTHILSLVASEQKQFARFYATRPERFELLPPGIVREHVACADPQTAYRALRKELNLEVNARLVVCLGSGFHTKGVDISINSFAALHNAMRDTALLIVGNDNPDKYREQARALGIADNVFFLGPRSPVGNLLHGADALLHPARKELAGNVILEAMLCGCPVLAADHCGYSHFIVEHQLGELISHNATPADIAMQLQRLLAVDKSHWAVRANTLQNNTVFFARAEYALAAVQKIVQQKKSGNKNHEWKIVTPKETLILRDELIDLWKAKPVFDHVQQLTGTVAREMPDRQTLRFDVNGEAYYRKWHRGVGWMEIIKNLVRLRLPVLGARNEWNALNKMRALAIPGLIPVAFGVRGKNPARQQSFIVTRELRDVIQLDHFFEQREVAPLIKRKLIVRVAVIARELHAAGINHRDFYLCHFMLREASLVTGVPDITLVDLHRAQLRARVPERWRVKDIGGLLFSSLNLGFSRRDYLRFLTVYFAADLRNIFGEHSSLLQKIIQRARKTYERDFGHQPNL